MFDRYLTFLLLGLAHGCLAVGFGWVGQWWAEVLVLLSGTSWIFVRPRRILKPPTWCLVLSMVVAGLGLLLRSPPFLMLFASLFLLAAWDRSACFPKSGVYVTLVVAASAGLIIVGKGLRGSPPFWGMFALAVLVLFSFERLAKILSDERKRGD